MVGSVARCCARAAYWPRRRRAADQRYELAPSHSITSSASNCDRVGHLEAKRPGRLQVDHKLEFGGLCDRQVGGLHALEDLTGVDTDLTKHVWNIGPIAHQPTGFDKVTLGIGRGNPMMRRERHKLDGPASEEPVGGDEESVGPVGARGC